ncbi:MAG: hypothetical protein ACI92G_004246 [Candidatus Pelagisphaera sp.]|jgi:hypothetical protein
MDQEVGRTLLVDEDWRHNAGKSYPSAKYALAGIGRLKIGKRENPAKV